MVWCVDVVVMDEGYRGSSVLERRVEGDQLNIDDACDVGCYKNCGIYIVVMVCG